MRCLLVSLSPILSPRFDCVVDPVSVLFFACLLNQFYRYCLTLDVFEKFDDGTGVDIAKKPLACSVFFNQLLDVALSWRS